jgi:bacillithiol system protein YtxJ
MAWFGGTERPKKEIKWLPLISTDQIDAAINSERSKPVLFFKHSTRCSISAMALNRFEHEWNENDNCDLYFLDLLQHRDLSNQIAALTGIRHESPQAILIHKGKVVYNASHNAISADQIQKMLNDLSQR